MRFNGLHPIEVKAGMNPVAAKARFGNDPVLHGGHIVAADNSIPNDESFENIKEIIELAKEPGSYRW